MYRIDKGLNAINKIVETSFSALNYTERANLQEWIADTPDIFGEELLVIQKEFDGFSETRERLDLLALDKLGNIVIIENKLDDTGRDVVRQSLKYASYCSTLRRIEIIEIFQSYLDKYKSGGNAQKLLEEFLDIEDLSDMDFNTNQSQRIILVAGNFRKEVTSTTLWLMSFGVRLQCFKATIYAQMDEHFLTLDQIIPIPDAEDYTIKMSSKQQEEAQTQSSQTTRHKIRREFRAQLLPEINKIDDLYANVSPSKDHRLSAGSGLSGLIYSMVATRSHCRVELYPGHKSAEENMKIFNALLARRSIIEEKFGDKLERDPLEGKKATRISYTLHDVSIYNDEDHKKMINFLAEEMHKLHIATKDIVQEIRSEI